MVILLYKVAIFFEQCLSFLLNVLEMILSLLFIQKRLVLTPCFLCSLGLTKFSQILPVSWLTLDRISANGESSTLIFFHD